MCPVGGTQKRAAITFVLVVATIASATACGSTTGGPRRSTTYRWHGVSHGSYESEITTIDGIADPAQHRYSMHIHSSVGTAAGGNVVLSDGTLFSEDRQGRWCIQRLPARLTKQAVDDLTQAGIDPTHWFATLHDGDTSPGISISRFTGFEPNLAAKVHRQGDSVNVEFLPRPGLANLVLSFTDFGRTPAVVVPDATKECPYTPSGD
jgi:hypothetical protein